MRDSKHTVIVTGANGGIGQALCKEFSAAGYIVIGSDIQQQKCDCDHFLKADLKLLVQDESYRTLTIDKILLILEGKQLKGLVNNAATQLLDHLDDLKIKDFQATMDINVVAPLILIKSLLGNLESANGSVVNIGSIHSKLTKAGFVSYATSKSALSGLSQSLAIDLGDRVRVNTIEPAATETEMLVTGFGENKEGYDALKAYHPLKRLAYPDEIASAALFLVSEKAGFISGSTLSVDGGIGCRLHDPE
jgi:NAD(P)-dependent dehydrogenase (short-subunit alcohol dehydrogenase family)